MTTHCDESDLIPLRDFELAWRLTDSRYSSSTDELRARIKPLRAGKARELCASQPIVTSRDDNTDGSSLIVTRRQRLEASGSEEDSPCDAWFRDLPIDPRTDVFLCWNAAGGIAVVTTWGTFQGQSALLGDLGKM